MNKQKEDEISKERSVRIFVASLKSPKTRQDYLRNLERFRKFVTFDSFDRFVERNPKEIQYLVENYVLKMRDNEHPNTIPTHYYPVQSFLEMNDVSINFKKIRRLFPEKTKTAVDLHELGTEAAAATGVMAELQSGSPYTFYGNHPFVYIIQDHETEQILFMGRFVGPDH